MQTAKNLKNPYPNEGIIRTAQIDDTVAPENSADLAVNMNFDRVGATQTRLGVAEYADQLEDAIRNYGTLNNFTIPGGYNRLVELGLAEQIVANGSHFTSVRVDDTHVLVFWRGVDGDGFAQCFEVNATTGNITAIGSPLEFDTTDAQFNKCIAVDSTHFMNVWVRAGGGTIARMFLVNGSYAVSVAGSAYTIDSSEEGHIGLCGIDSTHYACTYTDSSNHGIATILAVNTGTWAITEPGSPLDYDSFTIDSSIASLGDGEHFINFWSKGYAQVFEVNTGTWAITALLSPLAYDSLSASNSVVPLGDGEHFINFWTGFKLTGTKGIVQVFSVNLSSFVVGEPGNYISFQTITSGSGLFNSAVGAGDGEHFINQWTDGGEDYVQMVNVDSASNYDVNLIGQKLDLGTANVSSYNSLTYMGNFRIAAFWSKPDNSGEGAVLRMDGLPVFHNLLYAHIADEVDNWDGTTWTVRRSGLSSDGGKARFAQYLNYIWMCNGNATIGDPIAVSNGGDFSTENDIIPDGFPPVDYISAGFEGRIWGADALYGVIYYTDIVQFTPPDIYTLTYSPAVNFISQFAPQDGETITGFFQVPRALLVFTQNSIFRIYGATSIDAYPAYNVGTYSQESVVQTKTGCFFHHSSGFYQFDYGGQPVEISRRIIDFIQAIPRSNYENIVGVWDGFDNVEWAVGTLVVDGITFANCVCRFTISTQVWTIYDYVGNQITAMIRFDDKDIFPHLMGTVEGKTGAMDVGYDDFGEPFYFEFIDRWRGYSQLYSEVKSMSGLSVYHENAGGANIMYQIQGASTNVWSPLETIDDAPISLFPNIDTIDFNAARFRIAGTTRGVPIVIHGIEILSITNKGFDQN